MDRARLLAAAAVLLVALLLARVAFAPDLAPAGTLAVPAVPSASAGPPSEPAPSRPPDVPTPAPTLDELRAAIARLDAARAAAFSRPADGDPDEWATRSCACHAGDTRALRDLARDGLALRGSGATVDALALARGPTPTRADVVLTDRLRAYQAVDSSGRVVARWPATGPRRWRVTLVRVSGRWLFGAVARAP